MTIFKRFIRIPGSLLARNTILTTGGQAVRIVGQAIWVVLLARAIGPERYGAFAGIAGLATTLGALTGLGSGVLMLQDASREHAQFPVAWKRSLLMALSSGLTFWMIFVLVAPELFRINVGVLLYAAIGLPELICFPLTVTSSYAFQAHERMGIAAMMYALIPLGNLIAVGFFLLFAPRYTLGIYVPFHAIASIIAAVCSTLLVQRLLSPAPCVFSMSRRDVRESLGFSLMRLVDSGTTSLDKTLVLALGGSHVAGIYGSASRLIAVLGMPIASLGAAALPRLFRHSQVDSRAQAKLVSVLLVATVAYGVIAAFLAYALSGVLTILFGNAFTQAAQVARWLAISPLLYGLYALGCNVLVTSHRRALRILAQASGIAILAITALIWIPRFGLKGAVGMLLFSQGATALLLWLLVRWNRRADSPHSVATP